MGRTPKNNLPSDLKRALKRVGDNIRFQRQRSGMTLQELAKLCGTSVSTLSEIESRAFRDVRFSTLFAVAQALGVTVEQLIVSSHAGAASELNDVERTQLLKLGENLLSLLKKANDK